MTDPIADIIGDYRAFAAQQRDRLLVRGIDIAPYSLSHLAVRVPEWEHAGVLGLTASVAVAVVLVKPFPWPVALALIVASAILVAHDARRSGHAT